MRWRIAALIRDSLAPELEQGFVVQRFERKTEGAVQGRLEQMDRLTADEI